VGAGLNDRADIGPGPEPALAHPEDPRRDQGEQGQARVETGLEAPEVPIVDADDGRSGVQGPLQLAARVDLHEGREPEGLGRLPEVPKRPRLQDGDDQENRIRACAWYLRALANLSGMHRENAQAGYGRIAAQMTDGEIETARRLARAWKHAAQTAVPAGAPPIRLRRGRRAR